MINKEEIKKKLLEDPDWTLPDDASDEEWDLYFEAKDEMDGGDAGEVKDDDSWDDEEEGF
mgnify:CR=1 FL=1